MTKKKNEAPIKATLSAEEKLAILSTNYSQSDFCNHRDKSGKYILEPSGSDMICTKCGKTFTMFGEIGMQHACEDVCQAIQFIIIAVDMPQDVQDLYHKTFHLVRQMPELLELAHKILLEKMNR